MILITNAELQKLSIHKVGNKHNDEELFLSNSELQIDDSIKPLLMTYFLSPFKDEELFNLYHETDIKLNEVFNYASQIFDDPSNIHEMSKNLARHLYEKSTHQNIKSGEFYVSYIKNCSLNGEIVDAIGLFKSESKDTFLKIYPENQDFVVDADSGININKLDKGCLIFNSEKENGYVVSVVDKLSKSTAIFWRDDFLKIRERSDSFHNTRHTMQMCSDFIKKEIPKEFETTGADVADLLNRTSDYIENNDRFMFDEYSKQVLRNDELIDKFSDYKYEYEDARDIDIEDNFRLTDNAAKKAKTIMKSIIKLDKNFHIYVHGKRDYIEKSFDEEKNMNFYKLYFFDES